MILYGFSHQIMVNAGGEHAQKIINKNPETLIPQHFKVFLLGALNQSRTGDLILTMDALCQLSYEGIGAGEGNRTLTISLGS